MSSPETPKPEAPKTFLEKAKDAAANVAANAKAAAQIAGKQSEHGKLTQMTLPSAYWALGKDIHTADRFRDEFGDLFTKMDGLLGKIQSLKQAHAASDQPQKFTDRAKAAAGHAVDLTKAKAVDMEANGVLRELGKRAYEKHGESAGAVNFVQPIAQALARLETLDREIKALSESHAGGFLTPRRLLVGGGAGIALLILFFVGRLFTGGGAGYTERSWDELTSFKHQFQSGYDCSIAFLSDDKLLAVCQPYESSKKSGVVTVYDVAKHEPTSTFDVPKAQGDPRFSPDGKMLALPLAKDNVHQGGIQIWDVLGKSLRTAIPSDRLYPKVMFSPDEKTVICGDGTYSFDPKSHITVWDIIAGKERDSFPGTAPSALSPDGKLLAYTIGSAKKDDLKVILRDINAGKEVGVLSRFASEKASHPVSVEQLAFSRDSKTLAIALGSYDESDKMDYAARVELWDVSKNKLLKHFSWSGESRILWLAFSPDGSTLATGPDPGSRGKPDVKLLDLSSGKTIRFKQQKVESIAFSSDGRLLAAISTNDYKEHLITFWQERPGKAGKYQFADADTPAITNSENKTQKTGTAQPSDESSADVKDSSNNPDYKSGYAGGVQFAQGWIAQLNRLPASNAQAREHILAKFQAEIDKCGSNWRQYTAAQGPNSPPALQLEGRISGIKDTCDKAGISVTLR